VHLEAVAPPPALDGTVFNLASGSTLVLDNAEPIFLASGSVFVDGREVNGSQNSLMSAGVTVTGKGKLRIGPEIGTVIIMQ